MKWLTMFKEPIKFIHIDASHDYESVKKTIDLVKPKVVLGGIICGDDFLTADLSRHDLHGGVERAVKESFGTSYQNIGNLWFWKNH